MTKNDQASNAGQFELFLPYLAVIVANSSQGGDVTAAVNPERTLEATPSTAPAPASDEPTVLRISESPRLDTPRDDRS